MTTTSQSQKLLPKEPKNGFIRQKIDCIHKNPLKDKILTKPQEYYYSSPRNYASLDNELQIILLDFFNDSYCNVLKMYIIAMI